MYGDVQDAVGSRLESGALQVMRMLMRKRLVVGYQHERSVNTGSAVLDQQHFEEVSEATNRI